MEERKDFGSALCRERERQGLSLEAVAEKTKINIALLAGLERGDLARWPSGIFRRAFVRAYAETVGLRASDVVLAFERCFPEQDEDGVVNVPAFERLDAPDGLRLTLASRPRPSSRVWGLRVAAAACDAAVVLGGGASLAWVVGQPLTFGMAILGALYFTIGTMSLESSPGAWAIRRLLRRRPALAASPVAAALDAGGAANAEPRRVDSPARAGRRDRRALRNERPRVTRTAHRTQ